MRRILTDKPLERARKEFGELADRCIATLEKTIGKSLEDLQTPDEIAAAFEAFPGTIWIYRPDFLHWLWRRNRLSEEALRRVLLKVWRVAGSPVSRDGCPASAWRAMFKTTGFLSDGVAQPSEPQVLYRGCSPKGRCGMSWTAKQWVAEKLAVERHQTDEPAHVYKTVAPPEVVLAAIQGEMKKVKLWDKKEEVPMKGEYEFIIDARSLPITLVETARHRDARLKREERESERLWLEAETGSQDAIRKIVRRAGG